MRKLPERCGARGDVGRVLQASIWASRNTSIPDFVERDPTTQFFREGARNQSAGPRLWAATGEPPAHLDVVGPNWRTPPISFTQLAHPPTKPLVAHPGLAHNCC